MTYDSHPNDLQHDLRRYPPALLSVVLPPGLVHGDYFLLHLGTALCLSRLPERPHLPHLRLRRHGHGAVASAVHPELLPVLPDRHGDHVCLGIFRGLAAGSDHPHEILGLLPPAVQPERPHLPGQQPVLGHRRLRRYLLDPPSHRAALCPLVCPGSDPSGRRFAGSDPGGYRCHHPAPGAHLRLPGQGGTGTG